MAQRHVENMMPATNPTNPSQGGSGQASTEGSLIRSVQRERADSGGPRYMLDMSGRRSVRPGHPQTSARSATRHASTEKHPP